MRDDFDIFPDAAGGQLALDADVALITAYLAGELSLVQVAAVEERLAADAAFRDNVAPIVEGWLVPRSRRSHARHAATTAPVVTPAEVEAGWQRYVAGTDLQRPVPAPHRAPASAARTIPTRRISMTRIAATVAVIMLPLVTVAQAVVYAARHDEASGHALARRIIAPWVTPPPVPTPTPAPVPNVATTARTPDDAPRGTPLRVQPAAPTPPAAPQGIAIRPLGPVVATAPVAFKQIVPWVRVLSDGRVMASDIGLRLVLMLSPTLTNPTIVMDSAPGKPNSFVKSGLMLPYRGDSSIFLDWTSNAALVVDRMGALVRSFAPPSSSRIKQELMFTSASLGIVHTVSGGTRGAVVGSVAGVAITALPRSDANTAGVAKPSYAATRTDNSALLVAMDPGTRRVDTLATLYTGTTVTDPSTPLPRGEVFPTGDKWAVMTDGSVAILRAREYRLDWIDASRAMTSSPKLMSDWKKLTDAERQAIADSINAARATDATQRMARAVADSTRLAQAGDAVRAAAATRGAALSASVGARPTVTRDDIPDYIPPTEPTDSELSFFSDAENNVWIRRREKYPDVVIYDVANRQGRLIDRVSIPIGKTIVGFAPGFVFLTARDGGVPRLEKARIR